MFRHSTSRMYYPLSCHIWYRKTHQSSSMYRCDSHITLCCCNRLGIDCRIPPESLCHFRRHWLLWFDSNQSPQQLYADHPHQDSALQYHQTINMTTINNRYNIRQQLVHYVLLEQSGPNHSGSCVSFLPRPTAQEESHTQPYAMSSSHVVAA